MSNNVKNQLEARLIKVNGQLVAHKSGDFESTTGVVLPSRMHLTPQSVQDLISALHRPLENTFAEWQVLSVTSSPRTISPPVPFKTSTLQQEAYGKLGLPVALTMRLAQNLYEEGKISYMRTDSTHLSTEADAVVEKTIQAQYHKYAVGQASTAASSKNSKKKSGKSNKFAQEAHEAIRPSIQPDGTFLTPEEVSTSMSAAAGDLYQLIYQRTIASRMTPQRLNQTSIIIEGRTQDAENVGNDEGALVVEFRWSGSVVLEPGFTIVYDMTSNEDEYSKFTIAASSVPALAEGQVLRCHELIPESHITQPSPRYTEASLVKELEALGVGRPSTYASIVQILRDRAYVGSLQSSSSSSFKNNENKKPKAGNLIARRAAGGDDSLSFAGNRRGPLIPSLTAFVVCSLLEQYCPTYVDPSFTANMEERLDWIATGQNNQDRVKYLDEFYAGDQGLAAQVKRIDETVEASDARRARLPALLSSKATSNPSDDQDEIGLFVGPWGPYVQKLSVSEDSTTSKPPSAPLPASMAADLSAITPQALKTLLSTRKAGGIVLGEHPDDGRTIRLKVGRFGPYLQWGDDGEESTTTRSLPKDFGNTLKSETFEDELENDQDGEDVTEGNAVLGSGIFGITLEDAIGYVNLPRTVGALNDLPIITSLGPLGPYLKYNNTFVSLSPKDGTVLTVDAETAQRLIAEGASREKTKSEFVYQI
jgi:DNA topoisomerase-1